MKYIRTLLFLIICISVHTTGKAYAIACTDLRSIADTDTVVHKRSISVGTSYGSNVFFLGRTSPISYPYVSTDLIYNTKNGFFAYGSALKLLGYPTLVDELDVGGGYLHSFTKRFTSTIAYTRFIFNKNERVIESASSNDINWKNEYDWKILKSSFVTDYLFGKSSDFFVTANLSKHIEPSWGVFDDKDYLTFEPRITAIFGTQNFVERYSIDHQETLDVDDVVQYSPGQKFRLFNNGRFNALNYSFKIPVAYNRPHYTIEASYKYSIPVNVEGALMNKKEGFYGLTFYYVFY